MINIEGIVNAILAIHFIRVSLNEPIINPINPPSNPSLILPVNSTPELAPAPARRIKRVLHIILHFNGDVINFEYNC